MRDEFVPRDDANPRPRAVHEPTAMALFTGAIGGGHVGLHGIAGMQGCGAAGGDQRRRLIAYGSIGA